MAQSTTAVNACDVVVSLDDAGGTLTDISGSSNQIQINLMHNIGEYRRDGDDWPIRKLLDKDASVSLIVMYTTAADEGADILRDWFSAAISGDDARTIRIDIPDSTAGSDRWSGEVLLDGLDFQAASSEGGPVMINANFLPDGQFSLSTIS